MVTIAASDCSCAITRGIENSAADSRTGAADSVPEPCNKCKTCGIGRARADGGFTSYINVAAYHSPQSPIHRIDPVGVADRNQLKPRRHFGVRRYGDSQIAVDAVKGGSGHGVW